MDILTEQQTLSKLYEELREIDSIELKKFIQQTEEDVELNIMMNTPIRQLPFYMHLMGGISNLALDLTMKEYIIQIYKSHKNLTKYFIYNNNHYEGFIAYTESQDKKMAGDIKLFKFYDDSKTSTSQDTLELMKKLINNYYHVQWAASINMHRLNTSYTIFCKKKEKEGYKIEIYQEEDEYVYNIYNDELK